MVPLDERTAQLRARFNAGRGVGCTTDKQASFLAGRIRLRSQPGMACSRLAQWAFTRGMRQKSAVILTGAPSAGGLRGDGAQWKDPVESPATTMELTEDVRLLQLHFMPLPTT